MGYTVVVSICPVIDKGGINIYSSERKQNKMAIIVRLPTDPEQRIPNERFENLLEELGVECGISPVFHNFFHLNPYYMLAEAALDTGIKLKLEKNNLRGLFSGRRRKEIDMRLEEITKELERL